MAEECGCEACREAIAKRCCEAQIAEIAQLKETNARQQQAIDLLLSRSYGNTRNILFLRYVGIGFLGVLSLASALDWGTSATGFTFHGDRLQSIIIAVSGAGGLAALGFKKIEGK